LKNYIILDILKEKYKTLNQLHKCDVLEIGCGNGIHSRFFCNFFRKYIAIDNNEKKILEAKNNTHSLYENLTFSVDDILKIKITNKFNIILAKNVIHYMEKQIDIAFINILKLLKKNGIFIIIENIIKPDGWLDDTLNKKSDKFNQLRWNKKKKQLEDEHNYIINLPNINYTEYDFCRIYILQKK